MFDILQSAQRNQKKHCQSTIGIALGSGAAKGWAHIGVLNALNDMGIYPDKVAGCSAGAFVGAAYANDQLQELSKWVSGFSNWDVISLMDLSWQKGGIITGEKVFDVIGSRLGTPTIEQLQRPFATVATDLYSGQEVWFREGDLRQAVKASCSMPGFLSPVKQGHRWLVDGAVVNPVPVSLSRAMDVDIVIAVDLNAYQVSRASPIPESIISHPNAQHCEINEQDEHEFRFVDLLGRGKEYIANLSHKFTAATQSDPSMLAVMSQSMEILEQRHKRARLMGDPPEICIIPQVEDIGTMEFHRAQEAIDAGYQAVKDIEHLINAQLSHLNNK
ncbi:patatin-like phospholipase RssA [Shewanella intestini]|uniref:Patatin-like phospholipase RssA n=1 Tax=Shewanella intestini TaxID=2017544 RepID=A0ABS5I0S1_9GAMM|nr:MULTISPECIES: patatin-like phospholipase RssA [Shewanella]MBR9726985.1 patatin-like phospholipase RssA [Shewanella intestini]MRG34449.1 patatin-like phospholipase RssA [Shewanella sp. XMDDZSB0408]